MTPEQEKRAKILRLKIKIAEAEKAQAAARAPETVQTPAPATTPAPAEEQGWGGRAYDSVFGGVFDAVDVIRGNTYGNPEPYSLEQGDPTKRDNLTTAGKALRAGSALAKGIIRPVGEGMANAWEAVPQQAKDSTAEWLTETGKQTPLQQGIAPVLETATPYIEKGVEKLGDFNEWWKKTDPGSQRMLADALEASMFTPTNMVTRGLNPKALFRWKESGSTPRTMLEQKALTDTERRAAQFAKRNMDDYDLAKANLDDAIARGEKGTAADLTQDRGVFGVESGVLREGTPGSRAIEDTIQARTDQIVDDVLAPLSGGTRKPALEKAKAQIANRDRQIGNVQNARTARVEGELKEGRSALAQSVKLADEQAKAANKVADQAALPVTTAQRTDQANAATARVIDEKEAAYKAANETPLWNQFNALDDVPITDARKAAQGFIDELDPALQDDLVKAHGDVLRRVKGWKSDATPTQIKTFISKTKEKLNAADEAGTYGIDEINLKKVMDIFEDTLEKTHPLYGKAKTATRTRYDTYGAGGLGKARRGNPETFSSRVKLGGDEGAVSARELTQGRGQTWEDPVTGEVRKSIGAAAKHPEVMDSVVNQLRAAGKKEGVNEAFLNKYSAWLDQVPPDIKQEFRVIAETKDAAEKATKIADSAPTKVNIASRELESDIKRKQSAIDKRQGERQGKLFKRTLAKYADDAPKTVESLLRNGDIKELKRLNDYMIKTGNGASFKAEVLEGLEPKLGVQRIGDTPAQSTKAASNVDKVREALLDAGVITKAESDSMGSALRRSVSQDRRITAITNTLKQTPDNWFKAMAPSLAAAGSLTALPGSHQLLLGGAVRRAFRKMLHGDKNSAVVDVLEDMIANPEKMAAALNKITDVQDVERALVKEVMARAAIQEQNESGE